MSTLTIELTHSGLYTFIPGNGWAPVMAWATAADGSRQRTTQQERNEKGEALWSRYAYINRVNYGQVKPEIVELRMWAMTKPNDAASGEFSDDWKEKGNE